MRVAQHNYTDSMLSQFNALAAKQFKLQSQAATGLRVQKPAEDPAAVANTLNLVAKKSATAQFSRNLTTLQDRGNLIYGTLQSLQAQSSRVGEIATAAATATASQADLNAYAAEINSLLEDTLKQANAKDGTGGQFLFGGTAGGSAPFTATRDANNRITSVTYSGTSAVNQVEIGEGATASVDVPGANNSGSGPRGLFADSQSGADLFAHLISLRNNLLAGNKAAITATDAPNLAKDENNLAWQIANNGVAQSRLNTAATFLTDHTQALDKAISNESSADIVQTMVELNQAQTSYQAALQSSVKVMQLSILNYIS